jgi:streptomycin 6-kinase
MITRLLKNPWTTAAGVCTAIGALFTSIGAEIDGDPATTANWVLTMTLLSAAWGLLAGKDSEKAQPKSNLYSRR